jgi:hypothetical protein
MRKYFTPQLECLEDRWCPAVRTWTGEAGGAWQEPANWRENASPQADEDDVRFLQAGG